MTLPTRIGIGNDDLLDPISPVTGEAQGSSLLDLLTQDLQADVVLDEVTYGIPGRKSAIRYNPNIDMTRMNQWRHRSTPKGQDEPDPIRFSSAVIGNQMTAFVIDGTEVKDNNGKILTVRDAELRDMVKASDMVSAVRAVFGNDASLVNHANALLTAAGYLDADRVDDGGMGDDPLR